MIIKIFSNFCDSKLCKEKYEQLCEVHKMANYTDKRNNNNVYITTGDDYTHVIILNTAMPVLKNIPKKNVIGLAFEPNAFLNITNVFISYAQKYIGKYFIGDKNKLTLWSGARWRTPRYLSHRTQTLPDLFIERYAYMWHITPLTYIPTKNKLMSIMVSNKHNAPGHKYRHTLVENILRIGMPIDIYGTGASAYGKDARLKGHFKEIEPYEHYQFHICIENFQTNAYFSEKITNTLLCGATPIYLGCKRILNYFPANVIVLSGNVNKDLSLIRDILLNPKKYTANINVESIKDKLNLVKNIEAIFSPVV